MIDPKAQVSFLHLFQVFDSAFPYGSYAHSLGLEGLIQAGVITDENSLDHFFQCEVFSSLEQADLPIFRYAYESVSEERYTCLAEMDSLASAVKGTREIREAGSKMGKQLFILITKIHEEAEFSESWNFLKDQLAEKQIVTVLAAFCALKNIDLHNAMSAYLMQMIQSWSQACVKLLSFGPMQAQRFVSRQINQIPKTVELSTHIEKEEIGYFSSRWDIASSLHEKAHARLFIS